MTEAPGGFEYEVTGDAAQPTLVFVHGWPDDARLWRRQVAALAPGFRCVTVTLPNFGDHRVKAGGYDFPELVEQLANTIRHVHPGGPVGLVTHDWGAYIGYMLEKEHPHLVSRMTALDIGGHLEPDSIRTTLMILGYQWALVGCWLAGGIVPPLGDFLSRGVAKVVRAPSRQRTAIRSRYNYPYFYLWRNLFLPWKRGNLLGRYRPQCPVLYLWGERKPLMFHSDKWLQIVADSGGRAEGVDGAGHWLMETHEDVVNDRIREWFDPARSASSARDQADRAPSDEE